jgi:hypothetical protein
MMRYIQVFLVKQMHKYYQYMNKRLHNINGLVAIKWLIRQSTIVRICFGNNYDQHFYHKGCFQKNK